MTLWMPNKKKPLYAPMLATFGGGSVRGFRAGGADPSTDNFPVGHYETGNYDSSRSKWFASGYFGVDTGSAYKFSAGQDLTKVDFKYQSHDNNQVSFFVGAVEKTGSTDYRVQWMGRIDKATTGDEYSTITVDMSSLNYEVGNPIIPNSGDYYLGWHSNNGTSGSVANNGFGSGGALVVDDPQVNANALSAISFVSQGGIPSASQTFTTTTFNSRAYMRFRFQV